LTFIAGTDADAATRQDADVSSVSSVSVATLRETSPVTDPSGHSPTALSQLGNLTLESMTQFQPRSQAVEFVGYKQPHTTVVGKTSSC